MNEPRLSSQSESLTNSGANQSKPTMASTIQPARNFHRGAWSEIWRWSIAAALTLPLAAGLLIGSFIVAIYVQVRSPENVRVDAIVVLGTAQYNGVPSPAFKARLDEALTAYREGLAPFIVVTGGKQDGDTYTEAETGQIYLVDSGVPKSAILMEDQGRNSWQSMQGAAQILKAQGLKRVLIVSDGFHLFRLKVMARELGLTPYGRADNASPIKRNSASEFNYVVRETAATIVFMITN